jgi:hypothetical protein
MRKAHFKSAFKIERRSQIAAILSGLDSTGRRHGIDPQR